MITNRVRMVAEGQGLTVHTLSQKAGIAYGTSRLLWLGYTTRIDFDTLDRLCSALNVGVGDLFAATRGEAKPDVAIGTTKPTR